MSFISVAINLFIFTFVIICLATVQCCHQNRNITKMTAVTRKPAPPPPQSRWSKIIKPFKKATTRTDEPTVDYIVENVLISECCAGYEMTTQNRCIPSCPQGCPKYATCVLPTECQCNDGYFQVNSTDGNSTITTGCQPDCSSAPCPENSECIAPNQCACIEGYQRQGFNCVRSCTRVNCVHGKCNENGDKCECPAGHVHDTNYGICVVDLMRRPEENKEDKEKRTIEILKMRIHQAITKEQAYEEDEDEEDEDEDEEEETERDTSSTTTYPTDDDDSTTITTNCPEGFIQHKGDCRPVIDDAENAICEKFKCKLNSICSANGECICKMGYQKSAAAHDQCVSDEAAFKNGDDGKSFDYFDWINVCLIAVVSLTVLGILIKVTGRFLAQKGHFEVKDKQYGYDVEYKKGNKEQCAV